MASFFRAARRRGRPFPGGARPERSCELWRRRGRQVPGGRALREGVPARAAGAGRGGPAAARVPRDDGRRLRPRRRRLRVQGAANRRQRHATDQRCGGGWNRDGFRRKNERGSLHY
jgi:hypothetical protein